MHRFHAVYNAVMRVVDRYADQDARDRIAAHLHETLDLDFLAELTDEDLEKAMDYDDDFEDDFYGYEYGYEFDDEWDDDDEDDFSYDD